MLIWNFLFAMSLMIYPADINPRAAAAQDCEVLLEALKGTYEGDCRRGKAHGEGKAVGTDTYVGEFKKGLPHGEGTYTWANGDVYVGEFKKGEKEGEGTLTLADGTVKQGYWEEDMYIGTSKTPYEVINKTPTVNRTSFRRQDAEPQQIDFKFTYLGKPTQARNFRVQGSFGVVVNETDYVKTVEVYEFPLQGEVLFDVETTRDAAGGVSGDYVSGNMEFRISQAGKWEVTVDMRVMR